MPNHKSEDYKLSAIDYYLTEDTYISNMLGYSKIYCILK